MNKAFKTLEAWFVKDQRKLPWREDSNPYFVWISEIMLQQTQVQTVIPYFKRFIKTFPTYNSLAQATEEEVCAQWSGLGYYSRARNLRKGALQVVARGGVPRSREEWLQISGVGPYTAGAICSIAYDLPVPIVDGNVERVISRVECVRDTTSQKKNIWSISDAWIQTAFAQGIRPANFNQALMELGATICKPTHPQCGVCPLNSICQGKSNWSEYPAPKKRAKTVELCEPLVLCYRDHGPGRQIHLYLRKRGPKEWRAGQYDLPYAFEVATGPKDHLEKTVMEKNTVTHHKITRRVKVLKAGPSLHTRLKGIEAKNFEWIALDALETFPVSGPCKKSVDKVFQNIQGALGL